MARSFARWFSRRRKIKRRVGTLVDLVIKDKNVVEIFPGVCSLKGGGLKKYKKELDVYLLFKDDVLGARDCLVRVCVSTWWN